MDRGSVDAIRLGPGSKTRDQLEREHDRATDALVTAMKAKEQEEPSPDSPAIAFIRATARQTPFGTPGGINKLPYSLWEAVAEMMERYKADECPPGTHKWTGKQTGGSPDTAEAAEWISFCDVCGVENGGSGVIQ